MRNVPFSPPDVGEEEIKEIAEYCHTNKAVCLNSATACFESILHLLGIGPGERWMMTGKCVVRLRILPDVLFMWSMSLRRKSIVTNRQEYRIFWLILVVCLFITMYIRLANGSLRWIGRL